MVPSIFLTSGLGYKALAVTMGITLFKITSLNFFVFRLYPKKFVCISAN